MSRGREQGHGPTVDTRIQAAQRRAEEEAARRYKRDVRKLLGQPEFRRFIAQLLYGAGTHGVPGLRLKAGGAWKRDSEIHKEAARRDVAAELLVSLAAIDARGMLAMEQEHLNRLAEEADAASRTQEKEKSDADEAS